MSQTIFSSINPATTSGNQLATILNDFKNAVVSGFSGTVRPPNLQASGYWVDTTNEPSGVLLYKLYTGAVDITIFTVNTVAETVSLSGIDGQINLTKRSADAVGPIIELVKKRIANNGQTLIGDILGETQFKATDNTGATVISARIKSVASDDATITETGAYLVWETTTQDSTALTEVMFLRDSNLGVGVSAPLYRVHAKGATGIGSELEANSTAAAKFTGRKKRSTGQVLNGDGIVEFKGNSTDIANAEVEDAFVISVSATEDHTTTAHGTKAEFKTKNTGSIVATTKIEMGDVLNFPVGNRTKDVVVGTHATLATNAKVVRSGTGKASVVLGNDATSEGSEPTTLAELAHRIENFTTAGKPANSMTNIGRVIYVTDTNKFEYDTGTEWKLLSGGNLVATVANNQVAAADVTGFTLDTAKGLYYKVGVLIDRSTSTDNLRSAGSIEFLYNPVTTVWDKVESFIGSEDIAGLDLSVVLVSGSVSKVQYTSSNMSGTGYAGTLKFSIKEII